MGAWDSRVEVTADECSDSTTCDGNVVVDGGVDGGRKGSRGRAWGHEKRLPSGIEGCRRGQVSVGVRSDGSGEHGERTQQGAGQDCQQGRVLCGVKRSHGCRGGEGGSGGLGGCGLEEEQRAALGRDGDGEKKKSSLRVEASEYVIATRSSKGATRRSPLGNGSGHRWGMGGYLFCAVSLDSPRCRCGGRLRFPLSPLQYTVLDLLVGGSQDCGKQVVRKERRKGKEGEGDRETERSTSREKSATGSQKYLL